METNQTQPPRVPNLPHVDQILAQANRFYPDGAIFTYGWDFEKDEPKPYESSRDHLATFIAHEARNVCIHASLPKNIAEFRTALGQASEELAQLDKSLASWHRESLAIEFALWLRLEGIQSLDVDFARRWIALRHPEMDSFDINEALLRHAMAQVDHALVLAAREKLNDEAQVLVDGKSVGLKTHLEGLLKSKLDLRHAQVAFGLPVVVENGEIRLTMTITPPVSLDKVVFTLDVPEAPPPAEVPAEAPAKEQLPPAP